MLRFDTIDDILFIDDFLKNNINIKEFLISFNIIKNIPNFINIFKNINLKTNGFKSIITYNTNQFQNLYAIFEIIKNNIFISKIYLSSYKYSFLKILSECLKYNQNLKILILINCEIKINILIDIFKVNTSIKKLYIHECYLKYKQQSILDIFNYNNTLKFLEIKNIHSNNDTFIDNINDKIQLLKNKDITVIIK